MVYMNCTAHISQQFEIIDTFNKFVTIDICHLKFQWNFYICINVQQSDLRQISSRITIPIYIYICRRHGCEEESTTKHKIIEEKIKIPNQHATLTVLSRC